MARNKRKSLLSSRRKSHKVNEALLELRRDAISGSSPDPDRSELPDRADVWQKEHQRRRAWFNQSTESVHGTKYTYKPPPKRGSTSANSG